MGSSSLRRYYKQQDRATTARIKPITSIETTSETPSSSSSSITTTTTTTTTTTATTTSPVIASIQNVIRDTRSTGLFIGSQIHPTFTDNPLTVTTTLKNIDFLTSERGAMNDKLLTVDLTSSGDHFNDINNVETTTYQSSLYTSENINNKEITTIYDGASLISSSSTYEPVIEEIIYPSKEQHSILADSSKSEFTVDEGEPITSYTDGNNHHNLEYPASITQLTSPKQIHPIVVDGTTDLIAQHLSRDNIKDKLQPYHETVIYHNHPRDSNRARSVSYSTVIQSIPNDPNADNNNNNNNDPNNNRKVWNIGHKTYEELNKYEEPNYTKSNDTQMDENNKDERQGNVYKSTPVVYGRREQNYEVDEAVSVMSNGRVHGVQSSQSQIKIPKENVDNTKNNNNNANNDKKVDDNQKVGYVVEGRNYRKYRVEERTPDGFIVGEYGVLSHDDGSLRGVRYTADGATHPKVIYNALMKFLSL